MANTDPIYTAPKELMDSFAAAKKFARHVAIPSKQDGFVIVSCLIMTPEDEAEWMASPDVVRWPDEEDEALGLSSAPSPSLPGDVQTTYSITDHVPDDAGIAMEDTPTVARKKIRRNLWGMF